MVALLYNEDEHLGVAAMVPDQHHSPACAALAPSPWRASIMRTVYDEIQESLQRRESLAVLTVVKTWGSPARGLGTKVLVHADGSVTGTLGSARLDARAARDGRAALREGTPRTVIYHIDADSGETVGSCGASLEIFIEPVQISMSAMDSRT
jgi:xanthine/CO dehydrogenase XdhC/CoxF family maturation factor